MHYAGTVVRKTDLKQLRVGESSRQDIYKVLGAPTLPSALDPRHILYYASCGMKVYPTRTASVQSLAVYALHLDEKGILQGITKTHKWRDIRRESTETPSVYKKAAFIEEFLASSAARFK